MKVYRIIFILVTGYWLLVTGYYISFAQDKIVAIVNNEIITQKDLDDFSNFMRWEMKKEYSKEELLERLIEDRLILQAALKEDLKVSPERIKARIEGIKKSYKSKEEFEDTLLNRGLSLSDLESKIREQILMYDIVEKKIKSKISILPQEVTDYYLNHPTEFTEPEKRKVLGLNIEDAILADKIRKDFSNFKNFEEISLKYSLEIKDLGWVRRDQLREEISEVVFRLKKDEFSPVLSLDGRYYIFKLEEISKEKKIPLKDVSESIYSLLFEEKMKKGLEDWLQELKRNSLIKINEGGF